MTVVVGSSMLPIGRYFCFHLPFKGAALLLS